MNNIANIRTQYRLSKGSHKGVLIALVVLLLWSSCLAIGLNYTIDFSSPFTYLLVLLQTHLYTGIFITSHDAMHGSVSWNKKINHGIGRLCATIFMFNRYKVLFPKHHEHHKFVGTEDDPDFHEGNFFAWYFSFLKEYVTWQQILLAAISFNLLKLAFPTPNLLLFWILPSLLSTMQLFYFGTYRPHMGEHEADNQHKSHSAPKNHWKAFLTCYFFGYHYEHHAFPFTPWWKLHKVKEELNKN